ncbi:glycerol-3-phosphate dehydrogenase/oxidase [soil metagenome]
MADPGGREQRLDLLVIGAGITGVQIAREAAARGRSVLVVDKGDLGSGTSSATTKYLHGGIRYLEHYDVRVVRESLRERRIATLSAPHLVRQTRFLLPVWRWSTPGRAALSAGAAVYDGLAFDRNRGAPADLRIGHPRWLGRDAARRAVPWLDPCELRGAVAITDTLNVHPERLLLEFALDAVRLGAEFRTYTRVTGFDTGTDIDTGTGTGDSDRLRVSGARLRDELDGRETTVRAERVVNAAGPWMGEVLATLGRPVGPRVTPSKGVHLLTRRVDDGVTDAVMARARNGRHVVVSPWQGRVFIGPTDTPEAVTPDEVAASSTDVDELLAIVNSCRAPEARLTTADVDDVTVGIRPLVSSPGADTYSASRRHEVYDHADEGFAGLWSVAGGKWTTGRAIAADVVDRVLGAGRSPTARRPVPSAGDWGAEPSVLLGTAARLRPDLHLTREAAEHLSRLYGLRCGVVLDLIAADPTLGERVSSRFGCHDVLAQVVVAVRDEWARSLSDIIDRRLVLGTLGPVTADELARVAAVAAPLLGWADQGRSMAAAEHARRTARRRAWSGDR